MTAIIYGILISLKMMFGIEDQVDLANRIYNDNGYKVISGIVIIDTDEL